MRRAVSLALCLLCGTAFAQEGVRWQYVAPPECPSEQEFRDQVQARLLREPGARGSAASESSGDAVSVEIRLAPSERRATLRIQEPGAALIERTIEGDSCSELSSGLALITALAFGANAEPAHATAAETPRPVEAEPAPRANKPAEKPQPSQPANAASAKHDERRRPNERTSPSSSPPLGMEVGLGGWANSWGAPDGSVGADAFVRMAPGAPGGWSARVAGLYGFGAASVGERRAEFRFIGGRAEGCPLSQSGPLKLIGEACLALDVGALRGRGDASSALLEGTSQTVLWAAAVIVGRLRARLGKVVSLEGQGELGLPLVRHEFEFDAPAERIFRTPTVGFAGRIGVGFQIL